MDKLLFFHAVSRFFNQEIAPDDALYNDLLKHLKGKKIEGETQVHRFIRAIQKCNLFVSNKKALAFRLDPALLDFSHRPFAVFYIFSEIFFGFHIRFQDLARGGMRTVISKDMKVAPQILSECYHLAWTQQKKNKDIPEGGAKAVLFIEPHIDLYGSQKAFIESLLDLVNSDEKGTLKNRSVIDFYRKPEYIYLGPDENMHDSMIEWIANYSKSVGYKPSIAFISGKPGVGINHKQYGVTSHGVTVFFDALLHYLGLTHASVKMTGGPDGDVAGNEILNLQKYYHGRIKLIALIDASGAMYDPKGIDLEVCKELFYQSKPIASYPPEKLSNGGSLFDKKLLYQKINGEVEAKNLSSEEAHHLLTTHIHRIPADFFIPAGGRPQTLNMENIQDFFDEENNPTARAIVEGANLYLSQDARLFLEKKGVLIIRDSSANKGGVISSSFEVIALLTMTETEFLQHKPRLVAEILERIARVCNDEAELLLSMHENTKRPMSELSNEISEMINHRTEEELQKIQAIGPQEIEDFMAYQLPLLREQFRDRLKSRIPDSHKKAIIATYRATKASYR